MKKQSKQLEIRILEPGRDYNIVDNNIDSQLMFPHVEMSEIYNIVGNHYGKIPNNYSEAEFNRVFNGTRAVEEGEFLDAIDTILTYYMQRQLYMTKVDLDERNKSLAPGVKYMSLTEIEKELGHPVILTDDPEVDGTSVDGTTNWFGPKDIFQQSNNSDDVDTEIL